MVLREGAVESVDAVTSVSTDVMMTDADFILGAAGAEFEQIAGSTVLLTGGAGFLGYGFVSAFLEFNRRNPGRQISLYVLDNFARGCPSWLKEAAGQSRLRLVEQDITRKFGKDFPAADYIIHAASIASPIFYRLHPIETMDANVQGLRNLLEHCVERARDQSRVAGLLFFSSSEIYGDPPPEHIPTPESFPGTVSCTGPRACYDESKRYGETLCVNFAGVHKVPVKVARPFNNYGPGLKLSDRRVIPDFCRSIFAGEDIVILSNGAPTRTFSYVADAIIGYLKILTNGQAGEAYNIGTEKPEVSVVDLANKLAKAAKNNFNYTGKVRFDSSEDSDYLTDNPQRRCPDLSKARRELGYDPKITLEDGLSRTLAWYAANQSWGDDR